MYAETNANAFATFNLWTFQLPSFSVTISILWHISAMLMYPWQAAF